MWDLVEIELLVTGEDKLEGLVGGLPPVAYSADWAAHKCRQMIVRLSDFL